MSWLQAAPGKVSGISYYYMYPEKSEAEYEYYETSAFNPQQWTCHIQYPYKIESKNNCIVRMLH